MSQQVRGARVSVFADDEWLTTDGADPKTTWKEIEQELSRVLGQLFTSRDYRPKYVFASFEEWEGDPETQTPRYERR